MANAKEIIMMNCAVEWFEWKIDGFHFGWKNQSLEPRNLQNEFYQIGTAI